MLDPFENKSNEELLQLYHDTKRLDVKQEIALRYLGIIKSIAIKMRNVYVSFSDVDDMVNEGILELMNAIDRYDPSLNIKFGTYVSKRIRGMIIDLARKNDWIPRNVRKRAKDIANTRLKLYNDNGEIPDDTTVAEALDISIDEYNSAIKGEAISNVLSLDALVSENDEKSDGLPSIEIRDDNEELRPEEKFMQGELKDFLISAIKELKDKEQMVISLYYVEELSMKDIAEILNVSAPRVTQLHSQAIKKLRASISQYLGVDAQIFHTKNNKK